MMTELTISPACSIGVHGFCQSPSSCACPVCHLGPCAVCGATNLQRMYEDPMGPEVKVCAPCYRVRVRLLGPQTTLCEVCGTGGAFRNPSTRRNEFKCIACHAKSGDPMKLTNGVAHLAMPCTTFDINDPRHAWVHIRGNRFRCPCGADVTSKELGDKLRREYLDDGD